MRADFEELCPANLRHQLIGLCISIILGNCIGIWIIINIPCPVGIFHRPSLCSAAHGAAFVARGCFCSNALDAVLFKPSTASQHLTCASQYFIAYGVLLIVLYASPKDRHAPVRGPSQGQTTCNEPYLTFGQGAAGRIVLANHHSPASRLVPGAGRHAQATA